MAVVIFCIFMGCTKSSKYEIKDVCPTLEIENGNLSILGDSTKTYHLEISIDDINFKIPIKGNQNISFIEILKANSECHNSIAYKLASNNGQIKIGLILPEVCDTVVNYRYGVSNVYQYTCEVKEGICAPLSGAYSQINTESDIIKWLYRNGYNNVSDSILDNIRLYIQDLNRTEYKKYSTKYEIPVVSSLKDINYEILSDMRADYYYLFACQNEQQIEDFVEEVISLKFEGAEQTLSSPLVCYRDPNTSGMSCITLIGIDSNWSYKIVPVGLLCIDTCPPSIGNSNNTNKVGNLIDRNNGDICTSNQFLFNNHQLLVTTESPVPTITGRLSVDFGKFQGYGYMLNVPFTFSFFGDVNKIVVHRTKNKTEEIDVSDKDSPYHTTLSVGLDTGDNYIPIDVFDKRGNKSTYDLKITTERIKEDPVIENNIYN